MQTVSRVDHFEIDDSSFREDGKIKRTPIGGIKVPASLTRVGVFDYLAPDKKSIIKELRPPEEVFKQDSLLTLEGSPVTDLHPNQKKVNPINYKNLSCGHVQNVRQDGDMVVADVYVQDESLIKKIESGERREISLGYDCTIVRQPGVWNGQRYDQIQTNIVYNHTATGPKNWGRAGSEVKLRLDSNGNQVDYFDDVCSEDNMTDVVKNDAAEKDALIAKLSSELDKVSARADAAESKVSELETKIQDAVKQAKLDAKEEIEVSQFAIQFGVTHVDGDAFSTKKAIAQKVNPGVSFEGKSADYVNALYDIAISDKAKSITTSALPRNDSVDRFNANNKESLSSEFKKAMKRGEI